LTERRRSKMSDFNWFWQNAAFEIIWKLCVLTLLSAVLTWIRAKWPRYGQHLMPFLVITASIAFIWFALTGAPLLVSKVTTGTIENDVKGWTDKFGLGIVRSEDPNAIFAFTVTLRNGNQVLVERPKNRDQYLTFSGSVNVGDDQQKAMHNASETDKQRIVEFLTAEFARTGVGFGMNANNDVLTSVGFVVAVPITPKLTEDVFTGDLDRIDDALQLAKANIRLELAHRNTTDTKGKHN
jgi:hypothetical protein